MAESIMLRFGTEELIYLLRVLRADRLVGMRDDIFFHLDADHQELAMAVADRSLRARGVITWRNDVDRELDQTVGAALNTCVHPQHTVTLHFPALDKTVWMFAGQRATIEYVNVEPGVHGFIVMVDQQEVLARIQTYLLPPDGGARVELGGTIRREIWQEIGSGGLASDPFTQALEQLPPELASTLRAPSFIVHAQRSDDDPASLADPVPVTMLRIVSNGPTIWLAAPINAVEWNLVAVARETALASVQEFSQGFFSKRE